LNAFLSKRHIVLKLIIFLISFQSKSTRREKALELFKLFEQIDGKTFIKFVKLAEKEGKSGFIDFLRKHEGSKQFMHSIEGTESEGTWTFYCN
jgi:hypothetical protein